MSMLLQPDFQKDPLSLIVSPENQRLSKTLISNGMRPERIREILMGFYSFRVVLRALCKNAKNPEWLEARAWQTVFDKGYTKAIQALEKLLSDDSIPRGMKDSIIRDIDTLKKKKSHVVFEHWTRPRMKPSPVSVQQMIIFQSFVLFKYLRESINKEAATDGRIFDFMAELFRNLYAGTALEKTMQEVTGKNVKNWVDNAYNLNKKKNDELVECVESMFK